MARIGREAADSDGDWGSDGGRGWPSDETARPAGLEVGAAAERVTVVARRLPLRNANDRCTEAGARVHDNAQPQSVRRLLAIPTPARRLGFRAGPAPDRPANAGPRAGSRRPPPPGPVQRLPRQRQPLPSARGTTIAARPVRDGGPRLPAGAAPGGAPAAGRARALAPARPPFCHGGGPPGRGGARRAAIGARTGGLTRRRRPAGVI
jgi:hypothetical protein